METNENVHCTRVSVLSWCPKSGVPLQLSRHQILGVDREEMIDDVISHDK